MMRDQRPPKQWLIVDQPISVKLRTALRRLSRGSGVLVLVPLSAAELCRIRTLANLRRLSVVFEAPRSVARVHNIRELRRALLQRTPVILLSPMYPTPSHPDWQPIPRMRAAAFARLAHRNLMALGGMNRKRYAVIAPLGFNGWAGISAFRT